MQPEETITADGFTFSDEEETVEIARVNARRRLFTLWQSIDEDNRTLISAIFFAVLIVGSCVGLGYGSVAVSKHNTRTQAIERAKKMDGEIYTIKTVSYNWIGDTRLYLMDARGRDAGWVMIHHNNPFTTKVNPLYLALSKPLDPLPFPMKVRALFRQDAWTDKNDDDNKENFTGTFLTFEKLDK